MNGRLAGDLRDRRASTLLAVGVLAATVISTLLLSGAADTSSAAQKRKAVGKVRILAPKDDAIASGSSVLVRVRASGKRFRVLAAGRDVTSRFGAASGGVRTARLVPGRDFPLGEVPVFAAVGPRFTPVADGIVFNAAEIREDMLRVSGLKPRGKRPLILKGRVPRGSDVKLDLNGFRVPVRPGARSIRVPLGADDGLRHGGNRVSIVAHHGRGLIDRDSLTFRVPRSLALAGAGQSKTTRPGHAVTLDGSASIPASPQHQLYPRWEIVQQPTGAEARLLDGSDQVATFVANTPGVYVARLSAGSGIPSAAAASRATASEAANPPVAETSARKKCGKTKKGKRGKKGKKRRKCKAPRKPPPTTGTAGTQVSPCNNGDDPFAPPPSGCPLPPPDDLIPQPDDLIPQPEDLIPAPEKLFPPIQDLITIQVLETLSPMGNPIQTISANRDLRYGRTAYKQPSASGRSTPANWVHMLVINGGTGTVSESRGFDLDQSSQLTSAVNGTNGDQLVVLTGQGIDHTSGWGKANADAISKAFATLGGTTRSSGPLPAAASSFRDGAWSIIGTKGLAEGQATQNSRYTTRGVPEIGSGARGRPGSINGYVQEVLPDDFEYVSPEFVPIDTNVNPGDKTRNEIKVGSRTFSSETLGAGQSGFHLLVLDGDDPTTSLESKTFVTDINDTTSNNQGVQDLANTLAYYNSNDQVHRKPPVLILQSINRPHAFKAPGWVNDDFGNDDDAARNDPKHWSKFGKTIAGQVGLLAGTAAHDQFAQLGHDATYVSRNAKSGPTALGSWVDGGYTLVGSPFNVNGEENVRTASQAGSGLASARMIGALTRNAQSQWVLRAPSPNGGIDPNQLSRIAFQPAQPWPTGATRPEQEASAYIARIMFPKNAPPDLRARYQDIGEDWGNRAGELDDDKYAYPSGGTPLFDADTYGRVKSQLKTEMQYADDVQTSIQNFQKIIGSSKIDAIVNETVLANSIIDSIEPPLKKETSLDPTAILGDVLNVASAASVFGGEEAAPLTATLGVMANGMLLAEDFTPETEVSGGAPVSQAIVDEAGKLAAAADSHYDTVGSVFDHFYALMVSDWGKLQAAEASSGVWNDAPRDLVQQTFATADKQAFVRGLMPTAFRNYRIHPAISDPNRTPWLADTYRCLTADDGPPLVEIFADKAKDESGRAGEVRWRPFKPFGLVEFGGGDGFSPQDGRQGSTGWIMAQALAAKIDFGNEVNGFVDEVPRIPPASLMNSMFSRITRNTGNKGVNPSGNPGPLQMDKAEFFGTPAFARSGITCRFSKLVTD